MKRFRSLASRLILLAAAQMTVFTIVAIVIWWFTAPRHHAPPPGERGFNVGPWLTLASGYAVLALGALLTARWIVRPIERLSKTARAIGGGDLHARSELDRGDEIGELGHRVDEMAAQIEQQLVTERELLANVAHELRTPLSRIGVALDLAGEGDSERARSSLGEIAVDVDELETIVDDILSALRLDITQGAALTLRRTHVEPMAIAQTAVDKLRSRHPERPLELTVVPELPAIDVDPVLFRRVIDNLLQNAHKYTPDRSSPIKLDVGRSGGRVEFAVTDRGIGIAPADLPRVFTSFFRGDRSRSRETGGVGLGLTLARRIVEAHGGAIAITSEAGSGTKVTVSIPTLA
jgi:two-component system OmpR family sensor kinase